MSKDLIKDLNERPQRQRDCADASAFCYHCGICNCGGLRCLLPLSGTGRRIGVSGTDSLKPLLPNLPFLPNPPLLTIFPVVRPFADWFALIPLS